jgi:hypothetical protein
LLLYIPLPQPSIQDEFSNLLAAQTFSHGRLANPTHPMWIYFETFHELSHPTYASKYPPGNGLMLALGLVVFHQPGPRFWGGTVSRLVRGLLSVSERLTDIADAAQE